MNVNILHLLLFISFSLFSEIYSFSLATSKVFCQYYNCSCPNPDNEVKCKLDSTVSKIDFPYLTVSLVDFSDSSSLEYFSFGDTGSNINRLILRNSSLRAIHEEAFIKLPHLHYLDLSINKIDRFQELAFSNVNVLTYLNLSKSFVDDYSITRELCELVSLEVLDLSYAKLDELSLVCWKTAHLKKIYLRNTVFVDKSWQYWFPYIGNQLELIDLSYSDIYHLEPSLSIQSPNLYSLYLSNCQEMQKSSLFDLLKANNLINRLKFLDISNINASTNNFDLVNLITNTNGTDLIYIDISFNRYDEDLNRFLFNQQQLSKIEMFNAKNNQFKICNQKLIAGLDSTLLAKMQYLDLSNNNLDSSCLYSIKPIKTLRYLDLSHNRLKLSNDEFKTNNFDQFFTDKTNLTYIDLSNNQFSTFSLYLSSRHTKIDKFDMSNNLLRSFNFISQTKHNSINNKSSKNSQDDISEEDLNYQDDYEDDDNDENTDILIENHVKDEKDDDIRYLVIEKLNLSRNNFTTIFLQHMFQSIKNIVNLDLSLNPIQHTVGMSGDPLLVNKVISGKNETLYSSNKTTVPNDDIDVIEEALCIDELDLSNCKMQRIPNLQHTCINKIKLPYNLFSGSVHLVISKYSIYFLDYLDLQYNNIKFLKVFISEQQFKQDKYPLQNSPFHYFFGIPASAEQLNLTHTYIDLKSNKLFTCDCNLYKLLTEFHHIKVLSECYTSEFEQQCEAILKANSVTGSVTIRSLNQKLRVLFIITCLILIILSLLIVYYMCSDFIKNIQPYNRFKYNLNRILSCINLRKLFSFSSSSSSSTSISQVNNIGVHYSKLVNDAGSSQIEINA
jgi:hypothetical protein